MKNKISQAWVLSMVILLIIIMVGGDVGRVLFVLLSRPKDYIGLVNTEYIHFSKYKDYVKNYSLNYTTKALSAEEQMRLKELAWRQLIDDKLFAQETKKLDMIVGASELVDLVQGNHIDPTILSAFKDPKTGTFDKKLLLDRLGSFTQTEQELWLQFEQELASKRLKQKLSKLMGNSYFRTTLEQEYAEQRSREVCDVDYVYIPFHTVDQELCMPSQTDLEQYMAHHKSAYQAKDCKFIRYVTFPIVPDEQDHKQLQETLSWLAGEFSRVSDDYGFAKQHSDGSPDQTEVSGSIDKLPKELIALKHMFKKGIVLGPVVRSGRHYLYKITDISQQKGAVCYKLAVIEKNVCVGQDTRNKCYSQAVDFSIQAKSFSEFEALAKNHNLAIQQGEVYPWSEAIGAYHSAREVVRWLYTKAGMKKTSGVFDVGNAYMVVMMVDQTKSGELLPLSAVYNEVCYRVSNQKKAQLILDRLKSMSCHTLQDIATQYGEHIAVKHIKNLKHDYNEEKDLFQANKFVGTCFGLEIGALSKPIVDQHGVFIAQVKAKHLIEKSKEANNLKQIDKFMQGFYLLRAMKENAKIKDERYRFQ